MLMTTPYSADTLHPSMGFEWCINQDFWAKPRWFAVINSTVSVNRRGVSRPIYALK